jgi:hypothetical protein
MAPQIKYNLSSFQAIDNVAIAINGTQSSNNKSTFTVSYNPLDGTAEVKVSFVIKDAREAADMSNTVKAILGL